MISEFVITESLLSSIFGLFRPFRASDELHRAAGTAAAIRGRFPGLSEVNRLHGQFNFINIFPADRSALSAV